MNCSCGQTPCVCICINCHSPISGCLCNPLAVVVQPASWSFVSNSQPSLSIFAPDEKHEHPRFESTTGRISIANKLDYGTINLIEMYLEGKDFETNKEEYLDTILKLPWVAGNNLKACQAFERLKQLFSVFGGSK
jgi:hypothetical protein